MCMHLPGGARARDRVSMVAGRVHIYDPQTCGSTTRLRTCPRVGVRECAGMQARRGRCMHMHGVNSPVHERLRRGIVHSDTQPR